MVPVSCCGSTHTSLAGVAEKDHDDGVVGVVVLESEWAGSEGGSEGELGLPVELGVQGGRAWLAGICNP
uniref:Uncharacterized protein n=1 Tax=Physcomitrium patens TaxID=3218 RepID=A0A2K1ISC0_PHYPA|nr:hypothetical protein PHYPA_026300 [Physcomitrium patens]